jgi:SAM-dependent methyltransferase
MILVERHSGPCVRVPPLAAAQAHRNVACSRSNTLQCIGVYDWPIIGKSLSVGGPRSLGDARTQRESVSSFDSRVSAMVTVQNYYVVKLAAEHLQACYDLAPPRVKAYLEAEVDFVLQKTSSSMVVLELGCGYGRVLRRLIPQVCAAVGVDTSFASLRMAVGFLGHPGSLNLAQMDAAHLGFRDRTVDLTICIQNGISAFGVDHQQLFAEAVRVTRSGGTVLFSSYAEGFWEDRLKWFEIQAAQGLIGPIDHRATGSGVIVCKDGFQATTVGAAHFRSLAGSLGLAAKVYEVDGSSLFCEVTAP